MSIGNVDLGLCCINSELRTKNIFTNRTCRLATALTKGHSHVQELAKQNCKDLCLLMKWNRDHGIKVFRLSSDMFPHYSNSSYKKDPYDLEFVSKYLNRAGRRALRYNQRLSMHPGQYNQIGAKTDDVFKNTVKDLSCHATVLDKIEGDRDYGENRGILCIHGGGTYGDKKGTIRRFCSNFLKLPQNVRDRLCLENCEKCYNTEDCLSIAEELKIPMIFDIHHYNCYSLLHPEEKQEDILSLLPRIIKSWGDRKPYFHISEQGTGKTGHHSDYITSIPQYLFDLNISISLDIEAKAKEKAIFSLVKKYSD